MTTYGVTPAGYVIKPVSAIAASMTAKILQRVASDIDVAPDQPLGMTLGIISEELSAGGWELGQVAYNATNRGDAEGDLLDNIGGLTGTEREDETPSSVPCTAVFSQAGTYAAQSLAAYVSGSPGQQWTNESAFTVPSTSNDGSGQPISTSHPYTVASAIWQSTTDGPDYGDALVAANITLGHAGSLNQQVPVTGWFSIVDTGNVTIGTLEEEDPPYRVRQYQELAAPGSSTLDSLGAEILAALATVPVVGASVQMYENTGLAPDSNGLPGKSFLAVVYDDNPTGDTLTTNDQLIAGAIWNNKPAGIQAFGTYVVNYTDSIGKLRQVPFTRPSPTPVFLSFTVAVPASILANGALQTALAGTIATALVNASQGVPFTLYGQTFAPGPGATTTFVPGNDVVANALRSIVQGQTNVLDVPAALFFLGTSASPVTTANLQFAITQAPTLLQANIVILFAALSP